MVLFALSPKSEKGAPGLLSWFGMGPGWTGRWGFDLIFAFNRWFGISDLTARKRLGNRSEKFACRHLKKSGLRILGRNIAVSGIGEIDILAREGTTLVVVEVRSRQGASAQIPLDSINRDKRDRLLKSTSWLIRRYGLQAITVRQDIVAIAWSEKGSVSEILHIRDAFRPD